MTKRESYSKRMERQLTAWKSRFDADRAQAEKAGAKLDSQVREKLEASKVAGDAAFAKFRELRDATARYLKLRDELETAWHVIAPPDDTDGAAAPAVSARRRAGG